MASASTIPVAAKAPRFLDQVRQAAMEHYHRADAAERTVDWARRFILFHGKRHPAEMGAAQVREFLCQLAGTPGLPRVVDELQNAREALDVVYEKVVQRRFIRFHGLRHPQEMRAPEVNAYLTDLATTGRVAASTQNQALNALVFL